MSIKPEIETVSGYWINFLEFKDNVYSIFDIAHSLSLTNRYAGHTITPYSVAQHSVLASKLFPDRAIDILFHDAHEAYIGDINTPFKNSDFHLKESIDRVESPLQNSIYCSFGLSLEKYHEIKLPDLMMLITERRDLMITPIEDLYRLPKIVPVSSEDSRLMFLREYFRLGGIFNPLHWEKYVERITNAGYYDSIVRPIRDMLKETE